MKLDKSSGVRVVSELAAEMRQAIVVLAGERSWSETRPRWLERAARRAGISYRTARALFYCEPHEPRASVVERVRQAAEQATRKVEAAKHDPEIADLVARIARAEERLGQIDPEFFLPHVEGLRAATRPAGQRENGSGGTHEPRRHIGKD